MTDGLPMIKKVLLKRFDELLIVSDSGNEFLIYEDAEGFLRTEKQPREIWKKKRPRWPCKTEVKELT